MKGGSRKRASVPFARSDRHRDDDDDDEIDPRDAKRAKDAKKTKNSNVNNNNINIMDSVINGEEGYEVNSDDDDDEPLPKKMSKREVRIPANEATLPEKNIDSVAEKSPPTLTATVPGPAAAPSTTINAAAAFAKPGNKRQVNLPKNEITIQNSPRKKKNIRRRRSSASPSSSSSSSSDESSDEERKKKKNNNNNKSSRSSKKKKESPRRSVTKGTRDEPRRSATRPKDRT